MCRSPIRGRIGPLLIGLMAIAPHPAPAQDAAPSRAATEAGSQAVEADRLLKLGEFAAALPLYEAERTSRHTIGDLRYEAYALRAIGVCRAELGDDAGAIPAWREAFALDLRRDDPGYAGYDDFLIGKAEARLGRLAEATATIERALTRLDGVADRDHLTDALLVLGRLLIEQGRPDDARPRVARALKIAEEAKDDQRIADAWASLGQVEGASNHPAAALDDFTRAQKLFDVQDRAADVAWMETTSASALCLLNRPAEALIRYTRAAELHRHLADGGAVAEDLTAVAGLHLDARRFDDALKAATEAVAQARDADDNPREVLARVYLAQVQGAQDHWAEAAETLDEAVILGRQVARDDPAEQIRILLTAAATDHRAGLADRARGRLATADRLADEAQSPDLKRIVAEMTDRLQAPPPPMAAPVPAPDRP